MNQPTYLWKNNQGIYYFRARIPNQFLIFFTCGEIKKSLKTDSRRLAVNLARAYRVKLDEEMAKLEKGKFAGYQAVISAKTWATLPDGEKVPVTGKSEWNLSEKEAAATTHETNRAAMNNLAEELRREAERTEERARKEELHKAQMAAISSTPQTTQITQPPPTIRNALLSEIIEAFVKNKVSEGKWKEDPTSSTHSLNLARLKLLLDIVGDKQGVELTELDAIKVEETLPNIPKNQNKGELAKLPNLKAKMDTDVLIYPRLSKQTQSKHWELFKSLIEFAKQKKYINTDIAKDCRGIKFTKKDGKANQWRKFTDEDLQKLFKETLNKSPSMR